MFTPWLRLATDTTMLAVEGRLCATEKAIEDRAHDYAPECREVTRPIFDRPGRIEGAVRVASNEKKRLTEAAEQSHFSLPASEAEGAE